MKRGYKIAIVALVAIATNFGLHAAFGWGGHHQHWRNHHGGCGPNGGGCGPHGYYQNHHGCSNTNQVADPYGCSHHGEPSNEMKDTLSK